jgi:hypothetical protein
MKGFARLAALFAAATVILGGPLLEFCTGQRLGRRVCTTVSRTRSLGRSRHPRAKRKARIAKLSAGGEEYRTMWVLKPWNRARKHSIVPFILKSWCLC